MLKINPGYLRNMLFGAEDALVSTVGVLFGLAASSQYDTKQLILAGIVLISVEALSMGVGAYLTETEVHEFEGKNDNGDSTILDGLVMLLAYSFFGMCVLAPYLFLAQSLAKYVSVGLTMFLLFFVGYIPTKKVSNGVRMFVIASFAILIGFVVARIFE